MVLARPIRTRSGGSGGAPYLFSCMSKPGDLPPDTATRVLSALEGEGGPEADAFDVVLDLDGAHPSRALAALEACLARAESGRWVMVRLPAPAPGTESLFQPVGRALLAAVRARRIRALKALDPASGGLGFRFRFPGSRPLSAEERDY